LWEIGVVYLWAGYVDTVIYAFTVLGLFLIVYVRVCPEETPLFRSNNPPIRYGGGVAYPRLFPHGEAIWNPICHSESKNNTT